jgi:hypothetical protein
MSFSRGADPIWTFFDPVTGIALNDQYYVSFLSNIFPYTPSLVYQDDQGLVAWSDPIELTSGGALPPNVYFNDALVYRIVVRQGPTDADPLIDLIENYIPIQNGGNIPGGGSSSEENQISNPQFAFINFSSPYTITSSGTYNIAPGWDLVLTGSGTCVVTQVIYSGIQNKYQENNLNPNTVPPYALNITTGTFTTITLRQRFNGVGAIWYNNYVSASIFAYSANGFAQNISVNYVPDSTNGGTPIDIINSKPLATGSAYGLIQGVAELRSSQNANLNNVSYVDIAIILPTNGNVNISNVQILGQNSSTLMAFSPQPDETLERQKDHLFHYYADQLIIKPKNSILTGWNFALNPFQFNVTALTAQTAVSTYIADQTILVQQTANNLSSGVAADTYGGGLAIAPTGSSTNTQFALIQYIDPATIAPYWNFCLSSLVRAGIISGNVTKSSVRVKMRLIYRTTLPSVIGNAEPIASWALGGEPVFSAGWSFLKPQNDPAYVLPTSFDAFESGNIFAGLSFNDFAMPTAIAATMTLGIVIYSLDSFIVSSGDYAVFDKVSLVPNKFAVDTQPITWDENLRQCQYYYEKSYEIGTMAGTATPNGQVYSCCPPSTNGSNYYLYRNKFELIYKQVKRAAPIVTFYAPGSTSPNFIQIGMAANSSYPSPDSIGSTNPAIDITSGAGVKWTPINTASSILMIPNTSALVLTFNSGYSTPPITLTGDILYQYSADARLGL